VAGRHRELRPGTHARPRRSDTCRRGPPADEQFGLFARTRHMTSLRVENPGPTSDHVEDSGPVCFTRAMPTDISTIKAMFTRCSGQSRLRRFFRLLPSVPDGYLEEVLTDTHSHHTFVVQRHGAAIGFAELHLTGPSSGDLGLIIEDTFQRKGIGTVALQVLVHRARELGLHLLTADAHYENFPAIQLLRRMGPVSLHRTHDVVHIELDLDVAAIRKCRADLPPAAPCELPLQVDPTDRASGVRQLKGIHGT